MGPRFRAADNFHTHVRLVLVDVDVVNAIQQSVVEIQQAIDLSLRHGDLFQPPLHLDCCRLGLFVLSSQFLFLGPRLLQFLCDQVLQQLPQVRAFQTGVSLVDGFLVVRQVDMRLSNGVG